MTFSPESGNSRRVLNRGWLDAAGRARSSCLSAAQAAICAREENPSLARMFATCRAAVAGLMTSSSAMALLLLPPATSAATSRSRGVSVPGSAAAP